MIILPDWSVNGSLTNIASMVGAPTTELEPTISLEALKSTDICTSNVDEATISEIALLVVDDVVPIRALPLISTNV